MQIAGFQNVQGALSTALPPGSVHTRGVVGAPLKDSAYRRHSLPQCECVQRGKVEKEHFPFCYLDLPGTGLGGFLWLGDSSTPDFGMLGAEAEGKTSPRPEAEVLPVGRWKDSNPVLPGGGWKGISLKLESCICLGLPIIPHAGERFPYFLFQPPPALRTFHLGELQAPHKQVSFSLAGGRGIGFGCGSLGERQAGHCGIPGAGVGGASPSWTPWVLRREGGKAIAIEL